MASKSGHKFRAYDDALDFIAGRRDAERRAAKLEAPFGLGSAEPKPGNLLKVPLHPYQPEGALFAVRVGPVIIADDMGLGKSARPLSNASGYARLRALPDKMRGNSGPCHRRCSGIMLWKTSVGSPYYERLKSDLDLVAPWRPNWSSLMKPNE